MSVSAAAIPAVVLIASLRPILDRDNAVASPARALAFLGRNRPGDAGEHICNYWGAVFVRSRANAAGSRSEADDCQL
jgi:hypothetical protein